MVESCRAANLSKRMTGGEYYCWGIVTNIDGTVNVVDAAFLSKGKAERLPLPMK